MTEQTVVCSTIISEEQSLQATLLATSNLVEAFKTWPFLANKTLT